LELKEPTASSKEAKTHLQTRHSGAGALLSMEDCSVLGGVTPWEAKPVRHWPAYPHVSTHAGRAFAI